MEVGRKISSGQTFFMKWVAPVIWLGIAAIAATSMISNETTKPTLLLLSLTVLAFATVIFFSIVRKLAWDLMDSVYDFGDHLLVRKGKAEDRIFLANIVNVGASVGSLHVTLKLRQPCRFGTDVSFSPKPAGKVGTLSPNAIIEDLIMRVESARSMESA